MISIIIPTFNRIKVLFNAIDSVLGQTYQDFELIIVDDGSTDNTYCALKNYHPKIKYLKQENTGVSNARNLGIMSSSGSYIAFLDSDDTWDHNKLSKQITFFKQNPSIGICHNDEEWIRNNKVINQSRQHKKHGGNIFLNCIHNCLISPSAVIMHTSIFNSYGIFDKTLPACEDYDLWLRITAFEEVGFIDEKLTVKHGGHSDQLSYKHWGMDRFRIHSLNKIINYPKLNKNYREAALAVMMKKINIVISGATKRNNKEVIMYYSKLKENYSNYGS